MTMLVSLKIDITVVFAWDLSLMSEMRIDFNGMSNMLGYLVLQVKKSLTFHFCCRNFFFWMMEVCVDGTFFAFTGGSGLVTWPELRPFLTLKWEIGNLAFFGEDFGVNGPLKKELSAWLLRTMWCEEIFLWIGKFLMADWEPDGVLSGILYQLLSLLVKRRKFFQVFYSGIAMPWTQKLWMLNTRLEVILPFKTLHKATF